MAIKNPLDVPDHYPVVAAHSADLWRALGNIPVNNGEFEEGFLHFPPGTSNEEVWRWFEKTFPGFSVATTMGLSPGVDSATQEQPWPVGCDNICRACGRDYSGEDVTGRCPSDDCPTNEIDIGLLYGLLDDAKELWAMKKEINRDYSEEDCAAWDARLLAAERCIERLTKG